MSPPQPQINHFTHNHPLAPVDYNREFICDGCKNPGTGKRFRCKACNFNLHHFCGTCPQTLSAPSKHHHSLTLVIPTRTVNPICDVCGDPVDGLFYRCKDCDFDVHPLCAQLPEKLCHKLHQTHPLILESSPAMGCCFVCRRPCGGWRYRCSACGFDMHIECLLEPSAGTSDNTGNPQTGQRSKFKPVAKLGLGMVSIAMFAVNFCKLFSSGGGI